MRLGMLETNNTDRAAMMDVLGLLAISEMIGNNRSTKTCLLHRRMRYFLRVRTQ